MRSTPFKFAWFITVGVVGLLLTLTCVGAVLGIPMFLYGAKRVSDVVSSYED
jgi:hypothetical protein